MDPMATLLLIGAIAMIYFTPAITAVSRQHHNTASIVVVNIFLGWTFIGWVVALAWSFSAVRPAPPNAPQA